VVDGGFDTLRERQAVQFEPKDDVKGLRAINVRPAPQRGRGGPRPGRAAGYDRGAGYERPAGYDRAAGSKRATPSAARRGATGRRSADGGPASNAPAWRSSLSPFRGDPPSAPPRRRPK